MDINLLNPYVRRAALKSFAAPYEITSRYLYDYDLVFVADGSAEITIDGAVYTVEKNDLILIPPNTENSFKVTEGAFVHYFVHFDPVYTPDSIIRKQSFHKRPGYAMSKRQAELIQENIFEGNDVHYVSKPKSPEKYKACFDRLIAAAEASEVFLVKIAILDIISLLLSDFGIDERREKAHSLADKVKRYIDYNYDKIITLDDLEKEIGANKYTLSRKFKDEFKESLISYYNSKRFKYAATLLSRSNVSVTEVALRLSFADVGAFSRFFKKHSGISPREHRQRAVKK
ncbi:MAG: helix-turn-helix domain-containing protein [Clostridia bacterium]|nr:helix-turn-helix domain-containing protein [Clostridia bacterium]